MYFCLSKMISELTSNPESDAENSEDKGPFHAVSKLR